MEVYQKNFMIREQISIVIKSENIPEKSLSKQYKFWKIFCIIRREGNEGKSCCQSYIQSLYGFLTSLTKQLTFCISWVDVHSRQQIYFFSIINVVYHLKSVVIHFWKWLKMDTHQHPSFMVLFYESKNQIWLLCSPIVTHEFAPCPTIDGKYV